MKHIKLFENFNESDCGNIYFNDDRHPGFMYVEEIKPSYRMYWVGCHSDEVIESKLIKDPDLDVYWLNSPTGPEKFAWELTPHNNIWILDIIDGKEMNRYIEKFDYFPCDKGQ